MSNVKEFKKKEEKCDPVMCNESTKASVKIFGSMQNISEVVADFELTYEEFSAVMCMLDHYYRNWLEADDIDPDDDVEACEMPLPSILDDEF